MLPPGFLHEHEVPELVRAVPERLEAAVRAAQHEVVGEGAQQLVVRRARLVRAGDERIDDA
jgi:hypothetical protein